MPCIQSGTNPSTRPLNLVVSHSPISTGATPVPAITVQETPTKELEAGEKEESSLKQINTDPQSHVQAASGSTESSGHIDHRKFGVLASPEVIRRAEEQARGIPKSLAFNLLNILVDLETQAASNISDQNGKKGP
ncbi:uncharacterized protein LOC144656893 [Oculina patagonica]